MTLHARTIFLVAAAVLIVCLASAAAQRAGSEDGRRHVLILNSYHKEFQWTDNQVAGAREVLNEAVENLELYVEYMDTKRIYTEKYLAQLVNIYHLKYDNIQLDAIITTDDNALRFVMDHHQEVFQGAPVSFCGINDYPSFSLEGKGHFTGLVEVLDVEATIDLALKLHPGTRKVYVIVDSTPTGVGQLRDVVSVARQYGQLEFEYLKGEDYSTAELLEELTQLPQDSIVLLTVWLRDKNNDYGATDKVGPLISNRSCVPVYGIIDMYLGHGIIGGKLLNSKTHGRLAAEMAVRILDGERPPNIPVVIESRNPYMFDEAQLRRWSIEASDLPEGSMVINRSFSLYEAYRAELWSVAGVFAFLLVLITILAASIMRRRRAEEALRASEEKYRLLADNATDIIWTRDLSLNPTYLSPSVERLTGFTVEEALAMPDSERMTPTSAKLSMDTLLEELAMEEQGGSDPSRTRNLEAEMLRKDGSTVLVEVTVSFIRDRFGKAIGVLGISRDITDRKKAEEERLNLERQMQHAQKLESLGVLAGGIAHDFNNILVSILGYADLALQDMSPHAPARGDLKEIEKGARRAAELATQMLAYSGKGRFELEVINLSEFVEEMAHLLEVSTSKRAILKYDFADNLPAIEGDATQIRQVIMNLITNASEAVGDRSGVISVSTGAMDCDSTYLQDARVTEYLPEGLYVYFEVADTGCGMDRETQDKIFDPFFTTKFTGRGLGMAAVQGIMRGHKGTIKVYSETGKGTTFKALFPAIDKELDRVEETLGKEETVEEVFIASGTVLLVDDEDTVRALGKRMLEKVGFEVLTAADGREAVEVLKRHTHEIACVVLDLTMPHMDGEECFRELRQIKSDVRVVMSSGYNEQEVTQRFVGKGLAGFIQKPYELATLRAKLAEVLES